MHYQFNIAFQFAPIRGPFANIRVEWTSGLERPRRIPDAFIGAPVAERANVPTVRPRDAHFGSVAASATADAFIGAPVAERANVPTERPNDAHLGSVAASATADAFVGAPVVERTNVPTEWPRDAHPGSVAASATADAFVGAPVEERANVPTERPRDTHFGSVAASATADAFVGAPVAERANVPTGGRVTTASRKPELARIQNANDRKWPRIFANQDKAANDKTANLLLLSFFFQATFLHANEPPEPTLSPPDSAGIVKLTFPPTPAIERADLYFRSPHSTQAASIAPQAILILAPGRNGNGRDLIVKEEWTRFADAHQLVLCGLSFSSPPDRIEDSYSNAHSSSGALLLSGIDRYLGASQSQNLPLLLYGFSAGARFTASFVDAYPDRVLTWCGYAVGRWEDLRSTDRSFPPGLVACGEWDAGCYHASLIHFQKGRKLGQPWMWLSLAEIGHQWSPDLNDFVRKFFAGMLDERKRKEWLANPGYFDIDTRKPVSEDQLKGWPIFATWLPDGELRDHWMKVHHP